MTQLAQDTIYALAASGEMLYAGRASGLYRSTDGGDSWQFLFNTVEAKTPLAVTALAVEGKQIWAGVNGAVLRSEDGGSIWETIGLASPLPQVVALALSPGFREDGMILAGTAQDGVFVSSDRGATWTPWNFGLVDLNVNTLAFSPDFRRDRTIFVGTESGIFRSRNGGRSWREVGFPMDDAPVLSLTVAPDGSIYAGTERNGLYASDDGGAQWRQVGRAGAVNGLHLDASRLWLLLDDRLLTTGDGDESWAEHGQIAADKLPMAMLVQADGAALVGCADGDLLRLPLIYPA